MSLACRYGLWVWFEACTNFRTLINFCYKYQASCRQARRYIVEMVKIIWYQDFNPFCGAKIKQISMQASP